MSKLLSQSSSVRVGKTIIYIILIICCIICIAPFLWMVDSSFKSTAESYLFPPNLIPVKWMFSNYPAGWAAADFGLFTRNTVFMTLLSTIGTVISSAIVAYGFAKFRAKGSRLWFALLLGTMMLPLQVTLIPQYLLFNKLHMVNTYLPLIIPSWLGGGAFNIFLYHQFFRSLPLELNEAAKIDGASAFQTFARIMFPLLKPVALAVGVMALVYNWNNFLVPLIYLNSSDKFTLSIGLRYLYSSYGNTKVGPMMAVSVITIIPVIITFFVCQKYFIQGIKMSGIKI
jgi:multiple sugar transport system permease protein